MTAREKTSTSDAGAMGTGVGGMILERLFASPWRRYAAVAALIALAMGLRIWPLGALELRLAWLTFYPAVVISALIGGFSAGLLATALTLLAVTFWSPTGQPFLVTPVDWLGAGVFAFNATLISAMGELARRAQARTEKAKNEAEKALHDLRQTQAALVQAEKMASLGGLVAGVAHEINTPVGVALAAATHLQAETETAFRLYKAEELTGDDLEAYFATASEAGRLMAVNSRRASELIQSFKRVAVDQTGEGLRVFGLRDYLNEIILSLTPKLKRTNHRIVIDCPSDLEMESRPGALSQCLTNLLLNSLTHGFAKIQAGTVTIQVRCPDSDSVEITYADDGAGIAEDIRHRIFDPFFTTRRDAGGSGLGLHIVYNLVRGSLKGDIRLDDESEQGCAFILTLPRRLPSTGPSAG